MKQLPLDRVNTTKPFILIGDNHAVVSAHSDGADASTALAKYVKQTGRLAAIYRKTARAWVKH